MDQHIPRLMRLFSGLERAHGIYKEDPNVTSAKGKVGGRAQTVTEELTPEKWQAHIDGKVGVGVVPIRDDGTCYFSAIDFDNYQGDTVKKFVADAKKSGVPLIYCKSKSGGAHLYTFFLEPADAAKVRAKLSELARMLGYPKIEIFPKQEQLDVSKGEVGNWINLPYFNAKYTTRFAFDDSGKPIADLSAFLDYAEARMVNPADFYGLKLVQQEIPFSDGPPCIQTMAHNGVGEGERNKALFQFALYAKKKYPDGSEYDWKDKVVEWNAAYFAPALPIKEISATIFKSLDSSREYGYLCKEPVCSEFCNKPLCQTREFGVMGGVAAAWDDWTIEGVRKEVQLNADGGITTSPNPTYIIAINGKDVRLQGSQLTNNVQFRQQVFYTLDKMPPRMNNAMWDQIIQLWMTNCELVEIPYDLTAPSSFASLLRGFLASAPEADRRSDLLRGMVLTENDGYSFKFEAFQKFLEQQRYSAKSPSELYHMLRSIGVEKRTTTTTGNKKLNYWIAPADFMQTEED